MLSEGPSAKEKQGRTHVDGEFPEVRVELTREAQTCCDARHDNRDEVVKITVGGGGEFQRAEVDVIKCLIIDAESLIRVLNQLVNRKRGVIGLSTMRK